eukprot:5222517-Pyramimonas_sp.AAC.1
MQNDKELSAEPPVAVRVSYHMAEAAACGEGIREFYRTQNAAALNQKCGRSSAALSRLECDAQRYSKAQGLVNGPKHVASVVPSVRARLALLSEIVNIT